MQQILPRLFVSLLVVGLLFSLFVPTVAAFDTRSGDVVTIGADEIIEDDLFVGATELIVDGTVQGDLFVGATVITINGTVDGDLFAGGNEIVINGTVADDLRAGGTVIRFGPEAQVGDDVMFGGYSLEAAEGSAINGALLFGGAQALLAGNVAEDALIGTGALEIRGTIEGDVQASIGAAGDAPPVNPLQFQPNAPDVANVAPGLTLGESASIGGDFSYESSSAQAFPESAVAGSIAFELEQAVVEEPPTFAEQATTWTLNNGRRLVALFAVAALLALLLPRLVRRSGDTLAASTLPSFAWGALGMLVVPAALLLVLVAVILLLVLFGWLSLGLLSAATVWVGVVVIASGLALFVLTVTFFSKAVVGYWLGRLLLRGVDSIWMPLLAGLILVVLLTAIPYVGWLFNFTISALGLGVLWIMRPQATAAEPAASPPV